jgi:hypothetical protein
MVFSPYFSCCVVAIVHCIKTKASKHIDKMTKKQTNFSPPPIPTQIPRLVLISFDTSFRPVARTSEKGQNKDRKGSELVGSFASASGQPDF